MVEEPDPILHGYGAAAAAVSSPLAPSRLESVLNRRSLASETLGKRKIRRRDDIEAV